MFLPAAVFLGLEKMRCAPRGKLSTRSLELALIVLQLYIGLPLAIGAFEQFGTIKADDLEKEFQDLTNSKGQLISEFKYNKGL